MAPRGVNMNKKNGNSGENNAGCEVKNNRKVCVKNAKSARERRKYTRNIK